MSEYPELKVGLIGTGFMGKAHAFAFSSAQQVFGLKCRIILDMVADVTIQDAERAARLYGFQTATDNWRDIINNPNIDIVSITAPNALHKEMALAAIAAGKHVYCEKPLAPTAKDAAEMTEAADARGIKTQVGFNYLCNPIFALARRMIADGELGEIRSFRGIHAEDYMADEASPYTFRHDPEGGGALADLGSHCFATAEYLLGPICAVMGQTNTVIRHRPHPKGGLKDITVDDIGRAFLRFENGATGSLEASWIATGRKMQHDFEVYGSAGALIYTGERLNELHYYSVHDKDGYHGFRRIEAGPLHPPYGEFIVAPGHQIGFNDLKTIEAAGFIDAIISNGNEPYNFKAGLRIQTLVEATHASASQLGWVEV